LVVSDFIYLRFQLFGFFGERSTFLAPGAFFLFAHLKQSGLSGQVCQFTIEFIELFQFGVIPGYLTSKVAFDVIDQTLHVALFFLAPGVSVAVHRQPVAVYRPLALFQGFMNISIQSKPADE
jgi:hypothetical protein